MKEVKGKKEARRWETPNRQYNVKGQVHVTNEGRRAGTTVTKLTC